MAASDALIASLLMGQRQRPDPINTRRQVGLQMGQQGTAVTPVASPLEGIARALQGGIGGLMAGYADQQQVDQDKNNIDVMTKAAGLPVTATPQDIAQALSGLKGNSESMIPLLGQMLQGRVDQSLANGNAQIRINAAGNGITPQGAGAAPSPNAVAIAGTESAGQPNGGYGAVGPVATPQGNRAYGKYQVLDSNIAPWTQEVLGKSMTPEEFLANPDAQNKVFEAKFGQYVTKYGSPQAASRAWFAGEGGMNNPGASDVNGMTPPKYEAQFVQNGGVAQPPQGQQPSPVQPTSPLAQSLRQQAQALMQNGQFAAAEPLLKQAMEAEGKFKDALVQKQNETSIAGAEHDRQQNTATPSNEQALAAGFADRMTNSAGLIDKFGQAGASYGAKIKDALPFGMGNGMQTPEFQQYQQARNDFINAQLRRESGAAIAPSEYAAADKQYFPQPGDSPEVLAQKAKNRQLAVEGMVRGAGPAYRPSASIGAQPQSGGGDLVSQARAAIAQGAPRDKVIERLKAQGIPADGL